MATLIQTGKTLLDPDRPAATTLATLLQDIDAAVLREAVAVCDERQRLEDRGEIDALRARYSGLRRYLPAFFALPFRGEPGSEAVLSALDVVRQLDREVDHGGELELRAGVDADDRTRASAYGLCPE